MAHVWISHEVVRDAKEHMDLHLYYANNPETNQIFIVRSDREELHGDVEDAFTNAFGCDHPVNYSWTGGAE